MISRLFIWFFSLVPDYKAIPEKYYDFELPEDADCSDIQNKNKYLNMYMYIQTRAHQ